jgi:hypothetical protein
MKSLCAYSFFEHICTCTSVTGDDWEHEEIFTDDDEGVDNPDEREDLDPEVPAPPEIKQVSFQSKLLVKCDMSVIFSLCVIADSTIDYILGMDLFMDF